jgi:hypothetical protein
MGTRRGRQDLDSGKKEEPVMRTGMRTWVIIAGAAFVLALGTYGYGAGSSVPPPAKPKTPPKPTYIVVELMDVKGVITYDGIDLQSLNSRIATQRQAYVKALELWKKNKALADINKTKFTEEKPVKGYVRRVETTPPVFRYVELAKAEAVQVAKQKQEGKSPVTIPETDTTTPHAPPTGEVVKPGTTDETDGKSQE